MHSCAIESQTSFTAKGVVDSPNQVCAGNQHCENQLGQKKSKGIEIPSGMIEEAMESAPVAVADVAATKDDLGRITMTMRKQRASDDFQEDLESPCREDRSKMLSQV